MASGGGSAYGAEQVVALFIWYLVFFRAEQVFGFFYASMLLVLFYICCFLHKNCSLQGLNPPPFLLFLYIGRLVVVLGFAYRQVNIHENH